MRAWSRGWARGCQSREVGSSPIARSISHGLLLGGAAWLQPMLWSVRIRHRAPKIAPSTKTIVVVTAIGRCGDGPSTAVRARCERASIRADR